MKSRNALTTLLIIAAISTSCSNKTEYKVEPLKVETETIKTMNEAQGKSYVGVIEEEESVSVSFIGMGTLKRLLVSEGESVRQGQLLAEIDDSQARNMLDMAQTSYNQAEDAIGRYKQLYEKGSLSESKWIEAQSKLDEARVAVKSAEKNLADCRLIAPVSGIIGAKQATAGMTVLPSQAILTIYKINNVKVKVSIPEREIAGINASTPSHIRVDATGTSMQGGKIEKGILADALTHTYTIRIQLANSDHTLLPGMVCKVELGCGDGRGGISVPVRCVQQSVDGQRFVWLVDETQHIYHKDVTLGNILGNRIIVTEGLKEGDCVVTAGYQKVSNGELVLTDK